MGLTSSATATAECDACGHTESAPDGIPAGWIWIGSHLAHTQTCALTLLDTLVNDGALPAAP